MNISWHQIALLITGSAIVGLLMALRYELSEIWQRAAMAGLGGVTTALTVMAIRKLNNPR